MKLIKIQEIPDKGSSHNDRIRKKVILQTDELKGVTNFARAVFPPGEKAGSHVHDDMAEVFTVEEGCGEIRINEVAYVFAAGTTVVVHPGEAHEIVNTGNSELVVTYFGVLATD